MRNADVTSSRFGPYASRCDGGGGSDTLTGNATSQGASGGGIGGSGGNVQGRSVADGGGDGMTDGHESNRIVSRGAATAVPSLRLRLAWLREACANGTLSLLPPRPTSSQQWAGVLAAVQVDGADGRMPSDRRAASTNVLEASTMLEASQVGQAKEHDTADWLGEGLPEADSAVATARVSYQCADVRMLLTLALLPPLVSHDRSEPSSGSIGCVLGNDAAALGTALEVFVRYWLAQSWPVQLLAATLRTQMRGAALALCWLLEHRPALIARVGFGPGLLLDAVRIAAAPQRRREPGA